MAEPGPFDTIVEQFVSTQSTAEAVDGWADRVMQRIGAEIPTIADDAVLAKAVEISARTQWTAFLGSIRYPEREIPMLPTAAEVATELARRGHPLAVLFRIYRVARRAIWDYITDVLTTVAPQSEESQFLIFFWNRASTWIDAVVEASTALFEAERDKVRQGAAAQKLVAVRALIEGEGTLNPREASASLGGHPLSGINTAVLLHATDIQRVTELRDGALELAQLAGARNPLIVSPGGRDLWMWIASKAAPTTDRFGSLRTWLDERGIVVAVGSPVEGIDGFRLSHLEAQRAQRMAFASQRLPNPLLFGEVETLAMLRQSPEDAARFVARTLGRLAEDTDAMARLRQTARAALEAENLEKAGEALIVHSNTVRYRLGQIEKIMGRSINERSSDLALALAYHHAFLADGT
ncbi:hypothetical protein Back2_11400 [Nocardioides baekrokdamisoli]|uniref:PucR family transcriptional regulator n=1 Tax=Nocardioides baekrokdamisoli TaxID=1804624 RepID=A0A3G9IWW3_9ACTN|nr:helix-turn-helix domain-containing protein [Nocardioides baekrokdamisoli]BBH16853.1 hypothetical protein Back2_11400 [Nocardioides baekrokdamisoli]